MFINMQKAAQTTRGGRPEMLAVGLGLSLVVLFATAAKAEDTTIERGRYLVQIAGCGDCHTPGHFLGSPDMARFLGGSEVGFEVPGIGIVYGPNLTPDRETGLGTWTADQIVTAIRSGVRPDGRVLVPVMPWPNLSALSDADAHAIAAFLQSLDPVSNRVPGPVPPGEPAPSFVMRVSPPAG